MRYATALRGRKAIVNGELKFFDLDLDDAVISSSGTVTDSINKIAQGITEVTRVGRKCTIRSIYWHYRLSLPEINGASDPAQSDTVRVIMYLDKQCNGLAAGVGDVLETANFQAFRNLSNGGRFVILRDKVHDLNYLTLTGMTTTTVDQGAVVRSYQFYKKCNTPIEFNAAAGAITEIRSNNFGVLMISSGGVASMDSKIRLRFSD